MMAEEREDEVSKYNEFKEGLARKKNGDIENDNNVQKKLEVLEALEKTFETERKVQNELILNTFSEKDELLIVCNYFFWKMNNLYPIATDASSGNPATPKSKGGVGSWDDEKNINAVDVGKREDLVTNYIPAAPEKNVVSAVDLLLTGISEIVTNKSTAPFLFLCQSSGYGKTRSMLDLGEKRRLVYLPCKCLPTISGNGAAWKVPTALENTFESVRHQKDIAIVEKYWTKFLKATKIVADRYDNPNDLREAQVTKEGKQSLFYTELLKEYLKIQSPDPKKNMRPAFRQSTSQTKGPVTFDGREEIDHRKEEIDYGSARAIDDTSLVVCLDEASKLFDVDGSSNISFRAFRRAAKHEGVISICSDTTASISEIMPYHYSSGSAEKRCLGELSAPIFRIPNFDMNWSIDVDVDNLENLFVAGRPRWSSILQEEMKKGNSSNAIDRDCSAAVKALVDTVKTLLTQKVEIDLKDLPIVEPKNWSGEKIDPVMISVFSCRFGIGPQSALSPLLAKYSLATVSHISDDRRFVQTSFPSEPVLAEASAQYTRSKGIVMAVLNNLNAAVKGHILDPPRGDVGEMCAAALLGLTMDDIRKRNKFDMFSKGSVSLGTLLSRFGCDVEQEQIREALQGWTVNFTHFVRCPTNLEHNALPVMFKRRMAYYVHAGMQGLDMLIAMHHEEKGYATVKVQVKNHQKFENNKRNTALAKLRPKYCPPTVPDEKFSVGLLLCTKVDPTFQLSDYDNKNTTVWPPPTNRPKRNGPKTPPERLFLEIASSFDQTAKDNPEFRDIIEVLKDTCRNSPDVDAWDPSRHSIDDSRTKKEAPVEDVPPQDIENDVRA